MFTNIFSFSLIIISFIIITIFICIWFIIFSIEPKENSDIEYIKPGLGMRCVDTCTENLKCVPYSNTTNICKVALGQPCNSLSECEPNAKVCSGICSVRDFGDLNQKGPCSSGLTLNSQNICKYDLNSEGCFKNEDCISNLCLNKICKIQKVNGDSCLENTDCVSNNCSNNFCQPEGDVTGEINSVCNASIHCNEELECSQLLMKCKIIEN